MNEKKYTVGEVSQITGISKDTLRFYDKSGLLKPGYVDPKNNYRYYTFDQFWRIDIILCCRKLGISLEKIKSVLDLHDNNKIVELLLEHRAEALRLSNYYMRIADDISWYESQNSQIAKARQAQNICVKTLPERKVIGINRKNESAYQLQLHQAYRNEVLHTESIKRNYGYFLNTEDIFNNLFHKTGGYIEVGSGQYQYVEEKDILTIPGGKYACFITDVSKDTADFSPLVNWINEHDYKADFIIADEIGLQLYAYMQYPCEIKMLLKK
ncbi:MerR family transcriptional regulator [Paenibacillus peoriae]|uniref:MerR family transcriptional regulator n=1 Tax=Paenibacillus peoriae TaxID=59893 RepID=UPI00026C669B|nr:MerR family transcriptional regulator [Paenibacillus peoriae]MEC0184181.1 MerR family transcriptional regulator [Paenibacillus peoriae]